MPRYFFDIHDNDKAQIDEEGHELAGKAEVRREAQRLLPEVAYHEIANDGDHRSYVTLVRDERGKPVYSATLNYHGLWLDDPED